MENLVLLVNFPIKIIFTTALHVVLIEIDPDAYRIGRAGKKKLY